MEPGANRRVQRCGVSTRRRGPICPGVVRRLHVQAGRLLGPPDAGGPPRPRARGVALPHSRRRRVSGAAPLRPPVAPMERGGGHGALGSAVLEAAGGGGRRLAARTPPSGARLRRGRPPEGQARGARRATGLSQPHADPPPAALRHPRRGDGPGGHLARAGAPVPDGGRGAGPRPALWGRRGIADSYLACGRRARDHPRGGAGPLIRRGSDAAQRGPAGPREEPAAAGGRARAPARAGAPLAARGVRRRHDAPGPGGPGP